MFINLKKGVAHDSYAAGFCFLMQLPCINSSYAVETHLVGPATFPSIKAARNAPQQERGRISGIILDRCCAYPKFAKPDESVSTKSAWIAQNGATAPSVGSTGSKGT
ncbi:hypothetical protein [Sphingobacterium sp.]|uniref:hypothetical protein n=1 Tax=Sphingobacterium sp. TaxID=341027 RepID=UPI00289DE100|nr:hypothetical protein [Sphingobacterium sp.]